MGHLGHTTGELHEIMMEVWYVQDGQAHRNHYTDEAGLGQSEDQPSQHPQAFNGGGFGVSDRLWLINCLQNTASIMGEPRIAMLELLDFLMPAGKMSR